MREHTVKQGDTIRLSSTSPCRYQIVFIHTHGDLEIVMINEHGICGAPFTLHADVQYIKEAHLLVHSDYACAGLERRQN